MSADELFAIYKERYPKAVRKMTKEQRLARAEQLESDYSVIVKTQVAYFKEHQATSSDYEAQSIANEIAFSTLFG